MSSLRFNQVFFGLMTLSFISAFIAPPHLTDVPRVQFEGLFIPISGPAHRVANWMRERIAPQELPPPRPLATLEDENSGLRKQVLVLEAQVQRLEGLAAERQNLGDLNAFCDRFNVQGVDSGNLQGLIIGGALLSGVQTGQEVLYNRCLVGKIDRAWPVGAHVRLVTDPEFIISGRFSRSGPTGEELARLRDLLPIVQGVGDGQMAITNIPYDQAHDKLRIGDWVTVSDTRFTAVEGVPLGHIVSISRTRKAPLFADIRVEPETPLLQLNDLWVMTRKP
jgi:cell shape-determining protein MreC